MKNTLLPVKPYLSHSQYKLFKSSPDKYARKYFFGEESYTSGAMEFGKKLALALEVGLPTGDPAIDHALLFLPAYPEREFEIRAEIGGVNLLAKLDGYDPKGIIGEYKTGVTKWTKQRIKTDTQITFYCLAHKLKYGKVPKFELHWYNQSTGEIQTFKATRTKYQLQTFADDLLKVWQDINILYEKIKNENE